MTDQSTMQASTPHYMCRDLSKFLSIENTTYAAECPALGCMSNHQCIELMVKTQPCAANTRMRQSRGPPPLMVGNDVVAAVLANVIDRKTLCAVREATAKFISAVPRNKWMNSPSRNNKFVTVGHWKTRFGKGGTLKTTAMAKTTCGQKFQEALLATGFIATIETALQQELPTRAEQNRSIIATKTFLDENPRIGACFESLQLTKGWSQLHVDERDAEGSMCFIFPLYLDVERYSCSHATSLGSWLLEPPSKKTFKLNRRLVYSAQSVVVLQSRRLQHAPVAPPQSSQRYSLIGYVREIDQ
jgi:hypothetical protein